MLYYELLNSGEPINGERYRQQLIKLKRAIVENHPEYATRYDTIIFHHSIINRLKTIWKIVDGKFHLTRLIAQTLRLLTTTCSDRCRIPCPEYASLQNKVSKIGSIRFWPPSRRSSSGTESINYQKGGQMS